jgi:PAS domain-containing protein
MTSFQEIEIILARQLSEYLTLAIFIVDPEGNLIFYNEPAEAILGARYEETGPMTASTWSSIFQPVDPDGKALDPDSLPLIIALTTHRPAHSKFWIRSLDRKSRQIEVFAIPLKAQADRFVGAIAMFWEKEE